MLDINERGHTIYNMLLHSYYFRFEYPEDVAEYAALSARLLALGYTANLVSKAKARRPQLPNGEMWQCGYCWISENGKQVYDWAEHRGRGFAMGYYLELDPGQRPCPPVPESERPISRTAAAITWMMAEPGRSQYRASREFKVSQQAISCELKRRARTV